MNDDIIQNRAEYNVYFKKPEGSYEQAFDKLLADQTISTRGLGKDPFIVDEMVFDVNTAYFEAHGGYDYAKSFFEEAYRLAVEEIGGEQFVLSAVMHADERNKALSEQLGRDVYHYHLHVVYVPVVDKEIYFKKNNKDPEKAGKLREVVKQVSHSKKWPRFKDENGKWVNSYSLLQDRYHDHMRAAGYTDFERGERGSTAEHLSVLEFKTKKETERAAAVTAQVEQKLEAAAILDQKTEKRKKQLDGLEKKTAVVKGEIAAFADINRMGEKKTITGNVSLTPAEWNTVSALAKEGVKSRGIIAALKEKVSALLRRVTGLEKRVEQYEGKGLNDQMRYFEARARAPRRLAEIVADIMKTPPERQEQERTAPQHRRGADLGR
jgi:hypothetical protein